MVGKVYYKELQGSFKAYIKKQNTYCLKCKKPTNNKSNTSKQVINKLIAQKSTCAVFGSKKSAFEREANPKNNYKNKMMTYCSKCEKHTYNICPKKLIMIKNIKIEGISRCANCLVMKSFFDKINKMKVKDELEVIVTQTSYETDHAILLRKVQRKYQKFRLNLF